MKFILINLISILGLVGFSISFYIYKKKSGKKKLICPRKTDCDNVVHSSYSKIVGIPIEILGMIYYFLISFIYVYSHVLGFWSSNVYMFVIGMTMCSVIFSIYLLLVQAFIIRKWCLWCISSALVSFLIFYFSYLYIFS